MLYVLAKPKHIINLFGNIKTELNILYYIIYFKTKEVMLMLYANKTIEVKSPAKLLNKEGKERRSVAKMVLLALT